VYRKALHHYVFAVFVTVFFYLTSTAETTKPDLILKGEISGINNNSYILVPFHVPSGTERLSVEFSYTGKSEKTTIDLGIVGPGSFDSPTGFRGWSGGNKTSFTLSATDATPSYIPGPITEGEWNLVLGIPNIRTQSHATYEANVYFSKSDSVYDYPSILTPTINSKPGWYRGDFHLHSGHSDGYVLNQSEKKTPSPVYLTLEAAVAHHLDFIFLTDHNTISQLNSLRELQPYFDKLLILPGYEVTTFQGHANVLGLTHLVDFRLGTKAVPDWDSVLTQVQRLKGLVSINHPIRPSGELCMGCGWRPTPEPDYNKINSIEVINGKDADSPFSGINFWQTKLNQGFNITAIGGSDNHNMQPPLADTDERIRVGEPTTVVYAKSLTYESILSGIKGGHVFIDVLGSGTATLEFIAKYGLKTAEMGDHINVNEGNTVTLSIIANHVAPGSLEVICDAKRIALLQANQANLDWKCDGKKHWLRINVRDKKNKLIILGNPIYINR